MATFGAVKTAIARRLLDDNHTAVTDIEIGEAINEAIKLCKQKRFWFNTTSSDLTIASGDDTVVNLPTDFLIDIPRNSLIIIDNGSRHQVKKNSPSAFDGQSATDSTGRPKIYVNRDGVLELFPTADQDYSATLYYIKEYAAFLTDGTEDTLTNDFLDEGRMLIQNMALSNLHGELRQDEKMEKRYAERTMTEYNGLLSRTNALLKTGTLTIEQ